MQTRPNFRASTSELRAAVAAEWRERADVAEEREARTRQELLARLEQAEARIERLRGQVESVTANRAVLRLWSFAMGAGVAGLVMVAMRFLG